MATAVPGSRVTVVTLKYLLKAKILDFLYIPVEESFKRRIDAIAIKNMGLQQGTHASFMYKSSFFSAENKPPPVYKLRLHESLRDQLQAVLDEQVQNEVEKPLVMGYINQVLNISNSMGDYYRILPDMLHPVLREQEEHALYKESKLTDEAIAAFIEQRKDVVAMMKRRLTLNLISN